MLFINFVEFTFQEKLVLEVVFAAWWASLESALVDYTITFRGLLPDSSNIVVVSFYSCFSQLKSMSSKLFFPNKIVIFKCLTFSFFITRNSRNSEYYVSFGNRQQ